MNLDDALRKFDTVDANLCRLERIWGEMATLIQGGVVSGIDDKRRYENLRRAFRAIATELPAIDGWRLNVKPLAADEVTELQINAVELGEAEFHIHVDQQIFGPGEALDEYRFRFDVARRGLVQQRFQELVREIDLLLPELIERVPPDNKLVQDPGWSRLHEAIAEVERLAGNVTPRAGRWSDLKRHLRFGQGHDLHDIANHDWPSVRAGIEAGLYSELEPLPVDVEDLATLVRARPTGPVSTKLAWDMLDDEDFERLLFNLVSTAVGYENPKWLTRTHAPDRGRDLSVNRVLQDDLIGVTRQRVIIQAKHWLSKSISPAEVGGAVTQIRLWEPPPVSVLVIATSGRFTSDAVAWIEKHNNEDQRPSIEMWPDSHLESLLAERPYLFAEFRLRKPPEPTD